MRIAYLGPAGTYTHAALRAGGGPDDAVEELPLTSIAEVVAAVRDGRAERGVVPIENSREGSVNATLDALAFDAPEVSIVGESVLAIHHCLIARPGLTLDAVRTVASHPQALAQCAAWLRTRLPGVSTRAESSTAAAVRAVIAGRDPEAALGPRAAAEAYGGAVLAHDVEDGAGNETRFAWLARGDAPPGGEPQRAADGPARAMRTAVVFWPRESDQAGWLVDVLAEFARRGVNLTRIESRPRKVGLGEYVFFVDLAGAREDPAVAGALSALAGHVAQLRVLGSFRRA